MSRFLTQALPLAALTLVSLAPTCAKAQTVVHNNFGPGDTFDTTLGQAEYGASYGVFARSNGFGFTPSVSGTLFDLTVAIYHFSLPNSGTNDAHVFLSDGTSGIPGTTLETFTITNLPTTSSYTPETLTSTLHPLLTAGTTYYLVEKEPGDELNGWNFNNTGETGLIFSNDNVNYTSVPGATTGAYRVRVTPLAVPEPGSIALLASIGMVGAGFLRRRKQSRKAV